MNEDYRKGIRFLLQKCKEKGINVRRIEWVPIYSSFLSERDACYRFWYNVYNQERLDRIKLCVTLEDIAFKQDTVLFRWFKTPEGSKYWQDILFTVKQGQPWLSYEYKKPLISFVNNNGSIV